MSLEGIKKTVQKKNKALKKSSPKIKTIDPPDQQEKPAKRDKLEDRLKNLEKGLLAAMNQIETQKQTLESLREGLMKQTWILLRENNMIKRYGSEIYKSKKECELDSVFGTTKPKKKHQ